VAIDLLLRRHLAAEQPDAPADRVLSELDLAVLDMAVANRMKLPNKATTLPMRDVIAALGGHLEHDEPPGGITLRRGDGELRSLVEGARIGLALAARKDASAKR